jgi:rfaE bifunctional protein nucleotidyltransferase chain/domain
MSVNMDVKNKGKVVSFDDLTERLSEIRTSKKVVHCHGVFDLLHIGHIKHFQTAKKHGDWLVVTLTPDRYINKGPNRPYFSEFLRAEAVAALNCVDFVVINHWPTAVEAIQIIKPDYYMKGSEFQEAKDDLTGKIVDEVEAVKSAGGDVVFTDDVTFSSSALLNQFFSPFSEQTLKYLEGFKQRYSVSDVLHYIEKSQNLKVLVLGEAIVDKYSFSDVIGKAGKEPILVAKHKYSETYAGGVLALANHLSDFCGQVTCLTYLGEKAEHEPMIRSSLKDNVELKPIYKKDSPTIVKHRYLDEYLGQKLFEVYEINDAFLEGEQQTTFLDHLDELLANHDLVITLDYGHGLMNKAAVEKVTNEAKFLAVNTQSNAGNHGFNCISKYPKADFISIANRELQLNYRQKHLAVSEQLRHLMTEQEYQSAMITNGKDGAFACRKGEEMSSVPAFATSVVDRVGAGDAVLAISSLYAYHQAPPELVAFVGNVVGAEAVSIMGNKRFIEKVPLMKHIAHLLK